MRSGVRLPSAPPILMDWTPSDAELPNKIKPKPVAELRDPEAAPHKCCTKRVHNRAAEGDVSRCSTGDSCPFGCCTSVVHKPLKRSLPPSSRSGANFRRQSSGLMLRGRVFYLRLRVPRALEHTVGRTRLEVVGHFTMARGRQGRAGRRVGGRTIIPGE